MVLLSVIIPTYHRNDLLAKCLDCLRPGAQTLDVSVYEVIVSDDGRESTAQQLIAEHYPWARWIKGPQRGPAANRNNGARYARGEWLVFTDDDCLPDTNWLEAYQNVVSAKDNAPVLEGKTIADRPQMRYDEEAPINETGGNLWSCNFCIRKDIFFLVDGFDERFPYASMEDVDLNVRLQKKGVTSQFISQAIVVHPYRPISKNKYKYAYFSFAYFLNKHQLIDSDYRLIRVKHLIYSLAVQGIRLFQFKYKGTQTYLKEHIFYCKIIFIQKDKLSKSICTSNYKLSKILMIISIAKEYI